MLITILERLDLHVATGDRLPIELESQISNREKRIEFGAQSRTIRGLPCGQIDSNRRSRLAPSKFSAPSHLDVMKTGVVRPSSRFACLGDGRQALTVKECGLVAL